MADYFQGAEFIAETAVGVLVANAISNVQDKYNTLAVNYYNLYAAQRNFYFNNFQLSGEAPFATEQFGVIFYQPDYNGTNNVGYFPPGVWYRFNPALSSRDTQLGNTTTVGYWQRYASRYAPSGAGVVELSGSFAIERASIFDDWNSYQNRYEEHKRDVWNEKRWADQMGSLSYGVKEAYTVERGLGTAFSQFDEAQGQLISADSSVLNGLATFAGYRHMQKAIREDLGTLPEYQSPTFMTNVIVN